MRIHCLSCHEEINLDHPAFYTYEGSVKCFGCGRLMKITTKQGTLVQSSLLNSDVPPPTPAPGGVRPSIRAK